MTEFLSQLKSMLFVAPVALIAIIVHECAHGWISYKLGDPTPKVAGRLSLNPLKHLDLTGLLCLVLFRFGWAKPVPVNPAYYKDRRKGFIAVSLAGPVSNFIMAFLFMLLMCINIKLEMNAYTIGYIAFELCWAGVIVNIGFGLFNLIPLPPLDGSNVVASLSKKIASFYRKYGQYTRILLVVLLISDVLRSPLTDLVNVIFNGMLFLASLILKI